MDYGLTLTCNNSELIVKVCIIQHLVTALCLTARSLPAHGKTKTKTRTGTFLCLLIMHYCDS